MPLPEMKTVQSSKVFQLGYDAATKALYVRYTPSKKYPAGRVAVFQGVMPETANTVATAPSIGQALASEVEGIYPLTYL